ncbi:TetR family transcriptional regulator C-terminal domain-containing protein [Mucilaginibacter myungsuensis]|uniref:TetR/AcrR family transcriptional regulator n=1 Tax=Mucilaginibacter myungsuensis TaxID=649104 RepID=A0A929PXN3_9SPHI|nr:TetR family transcriptional regulator C-terminal domain-containing protein [Mucilaginibacter myungsuensis]MBE9664038.1 TetR/AcrR family transcriptional regulator [Mucilaginibacter myungsuensis]MDN3601217.1 TetR family transcriptional regulator C-terminal domain-containing protein [Mucilaginibacter myungsuensis]
MATADSIRDAYIDYVLTEGHEPESVYKFAKANEMTEAEFYNFYGSFEGLEQTIWSGFVQRTINEVKAQEIWPQYSSREKALSFFYSFFELLKGNRSFAIYSYKKAPRTLGAPRVFTKMKDIFEEFAQQILNEGLESQELSDRKSFSKKYKDALWVQLGFVLNFWMADNSAGFEKTDEAIEKGLNVTFDLFQRSPIDNLLEYGKFLAKNGGFKEAMGL